MRVGRHARRRSRPLIDASEDGTTVVVESPYRQPEVPAGVEADRRLDAQLDALMAAGCEQRRREHARAVRLRRILVVTSVLAALWLVVDVALMAGLGLKGTFFGASALVCGIAIPTGLVLALGMKTPPRPEDAAPVVSTHRVG